MGGWHCLPTRPGRLCLRRRPQLPRRPDISGHHFPHAEGDGIGCCADDDAFPDCHAPCLPDDPECCGAPNLCGGPHGTADDPGCYTPPDNPDAA